MHNDFAAAENGCIDRGEFSIVIPEILCYNEKNYMWRHFYESELPILPARV